MEKKESLVNKEGDLKPKPSIIPRKLANLYNKLFVVIKFILGFCLLPFIYSTTVSFLGELGLIDKLLQNCFWSGLITLLIVYLFVWEPAIIYAKGQKILELVFSFFKPLVKVAPYLMPIYTIILFIIYIILFYIFKAQGLIGYFIFLFGFSIALHLIFSAKSIRSKQEDFLKANYLFGFSFVYILNIVILAFILNLIFDKFSFIGFSNNTFQIAKNIFVVTFRQLFL